MTIQSIQNSANNHNTAASLTWDAINSIGSKYGIPKIDYQTFDQRYQSDPTIKNLVKSYDSTGIIIDTTSSAGDIPIKKSKPSTLSTAAKRATNKALNK